MAAHTLVQQVVDSNSNEDEVAKDLVWSLFNSAAVSYKIDSLLRPFPTSFVNIQGEKDIDSLREVLTSMPPLGDVFNRVDSHDHIIAQQMSLLNWVIHNRNFTFAKHNTEKLEDLKSITGEHLPVGEPSLLFEVVYNQSAEAKFQSTRGERKTMYAYHGSKVENFYSILKHGLIIHMNKTSLFGEGTYLTAEPSVAMGFSPWGGGWKNSVIGDQLSILALCEVIDHPSVKCPSKNSDSTTQKRAPNSMAGDVPDKYLVVTNNEMVRVKYLLVYAKHSQQLTKERSSENRQVQLQPSPFRMYVQRHKQAFLLMFYILILFIIGLLNSKRFWLRVRQLYELSFEHWNHFKEGQPTEL